MTESIYERINKVLTWKRILAFNFVLVLVLIVPLSVRLTQIDTENRSNAAGELTASPTPIPNYPKVAPVIERVSTFYGKPGDSLVILGSNFGDYQWASKVMVGNVEAQKNDVVSWKNGVIEVKIPEGARTGNVSVVVNSQTANWDGKLLLYDVSKTIKVGMSKSSATAAALWVEKADNIARGMVELAYVTEPLTITQTDATTITPAPPTVDLLSKKMKVDFVVNQTLPRAQTQLMTIEHPQVGSIEITRVELYDRNGSLVEAYSDPLSQKITP